MQNLAQIFMKNSISSITPPKKKKGGLYAIFKKNSDVQMQVGFAFINGREKRGSLCTFNVNY